MLSPGILVSVSLLHSIVTQFHTRLFLVLFVAAVKLELERGGTLDESTNT
jgi:hypothetical protein